MTTTNDELMIKLIQIEQELVFIKSELKEIKSGTAKMESHITFVDSIYFQVKSPFHYLMNCVKNIKGTETLDIANE